MPFIENIKPILLGALKYPAYARPEYFLKKQPEGGWSKKVFLQSLQELCKGYRHHNVFLRTQVRSNERNINNEEIGLSLADESNGLITEFETSFGKRYHLITDNVTLYLMDAIEVASHLNEPEVKYSDLQIVSFFETAIGFIRNEFKVQAGIEEDPFLINRTYTKRQIGQSDEGETEYVLHDYYIACPKPFFHYYTFKESIRNLLLNSQHGEKLKVMLQHTVEDVKLIIKTWNEVIQPVATDGKNLVKNQRFITFTDENASYTASFGQSMERASKGKTHYTNYNLVKFASDAGHIVANDVIGEDQSEAAIPSIIGVKPTVASYALLHVYWSKYDQSKSITKTNKLFYSEKYSVSDNTLFTEYMFYLDKKNRQQLPEGKKEIKSSVVPFIKRFEDATRMLQEVHSTAHKDALSELNDLKTIYAAYLE